MKLIESKAELLLQPDGLEGVYKQIEICGRICYKSTDKITDESAKPFVERMIASKHTAMLEHGTVYLNIFPEDDFGSDSIGFFIHNKYSICTRVMSNNIGYAITTNFRVIVENNLDTVMKYVCEPTEFHEKRYTIKFTTDRGVMAELTRHRAFSFSIESTRYCNYSKDKFGGEITCINNPNGQLFPITYCLMDAYKYAEKAYFKLLENGCTPQQARAVLPNALKTEVCMTGFASDWRFFFDLRYYGETGKPHPDMELLASKARSEFMKAGLWDDIMSYPSRFDHE